MHNIPPNISIHKRDLRKGIYTGKLSFCWMFFVCLWKKNENSVLVAVKLTSGLYAPEEFWRLTLKKIKDLLHPFQNCLGKENKRRWCADPISPQHWELSEIILFRKQFSIKRILNKFEHPIAYGNKKPHGVLSDSLLLRVCFEVLWGINKSGREHLFQR